jgi:methylated-DNA-[protein]-cysteine S-methyltransferase
MNVTPIVIASMETPRLGRVWAACSGRGLVAVDFGVSRAQFEESVFRLTGGQPGYSRRRLRKALSEIAQYLAGRRRNFDLRVDWSVLHSDFHRAALRAVMRIPYGQTRSYARIAAEIGRPKAPRAVGRANATNPMPLVIPCHRVIGSDGRLHGYGGKGGINTKAWLLRMESTAAARSW